MTYHLRVAEEEEERGGEGEREGEKEREKEEREGERGREMERGREGEREREKEREGERRRERMEEFQIHPRSGVLPPNYHADIKVNPLTIYSNRLATEWCVLSC